MGKFKVGNYFVRHPSVEIDCKEFEAGDCVTLLEGVKIKGNKVKLGDYVRFCPYSEIGGGGGVPNSHSNVTIGNNVLVCAHALINNAREVIIGDDVGIGQYVHIWTHGGWMNVLNGYPATFKSVQIGSHVWIPEKTSILAGVTIGNHIIIGNNSLVAKDIPDGCFAAGIPCKVIRGDAYPRPLTETETNSRINRLIDEWLKECSFKGIKQSPQIKHLEGMIIFNNAAFFDTKTMLISGELDEIGEDFRDHLRRNGIKFFTGKPFKSLLVK